MLIHCFYRTIYVSIDAFKILVGNYEMPAAILLYVFENVAWRGLPFRDASDVLFDKYIVDAFASVARTHDPIPYVKFLEARGYQSILDIMEKTGTMDAGDKKKIWA